MPSAHHQSLMRKQKAMQRTLQKVDEEKIKPGNMYMCLQFANAYGDETCSPLWKEWFKVCNNEDWDDDCDAVVDEWYAQDLDWNMPESIDTECMIHWDNWDDVNNCHAKAEKMWKQCNA